MQLEDKTACVTDLAFDQWFAREHAAEREAVIEDHVRSCARCRVRGELLQREREAFLARAPTLEANARFASGPVPPADARARPSWRDALLLGAVAVTALAVVWLLPSASSLSGALSQLDGERRKGSFGVGFYVKRGDRVKRGTSSEPVRPGDLLRFTYSSDAPMYFALFGRDARSASAYFPTSGEAAQLRAGRDEPLDFSLELDDQLGVERLFAVACPKAYALEPVRRSLLREPAGDQSHIQAPADCVVREIALQKEAP